MVARLPDREAIIPSRIFISLANQLAVEPESAVRMQSLGSLEDNSQKTRCGLIGLASFMARASITFHQRSISFSICFLQLLSVFLFNNGMSACNVLLLSPCRF